MEKLIKNSFFSPVCNFEGVDYSDDEVHEYELRDFVKKGPSGESSDFIVEKKPVETDCYHLNKVIAERVKGCDLKSIIARIKATGDISILQQREVVYGDATKQPDNLSDALQEGVRTASFIDSLTDEEKQRLLKIAKMSDEEYTEYIKSEVDKKKTSTNEVKGEENNG